MRLSVNDLPESRRFFKISVIIPSKKIHSQTERQIWNCRWWTWRESDSRFRNANAASYHLTTGPRRDYAQFSIINFQTNLNIKIQSYKYFFSSFKLLILTTGGLTSSILSSRSSKIGLMPNDCAGKISFSKLSPTIAVSSGSAFIFSNTARNAAGSGLARRQHRAKKFQNGAVRKYWRWQTLDSK